MQIIPHSTGQLSIMYGSKIPVNSTSNLNAFFQATLVPDRCFYPTHVTLSLLDQTGI